MEAFRHFLGPTDKVQSFYSDASPELEGAAREMGWPHTTSTPGQPQTNGVAERAVSAVLVGARTALEHSGVPMQWWTCLPALVPCSQCPNAGRQFGMEPPSQGWALGG